MAAEDGEGETPAGARTPPRVSDSSAQAAGAVGRRAGKSLREIAADPYGRKQVDADWRADGWMRVRVRRLVQRSRDVALGDGTGPRPPGRRHPGGAGPECAGDAVRRRSADARTDNDLELSHTKTADWPLQNLWGTPVASFETAVTDLQEPRCRDGMEESTVGSVILKARRPFSRNDEPEAAWFGQVPGTPKTPVAAGVNGVAMRWMSLGDNRAAEPLT